MSVVIRPCTKSEFGPVLRACEAAFGRGVSEDEVRRWAPVVDSTRLLGAFVDDVPVGSAGACALTVTVPGGLVAAAGVTMVGILPSHRRRGIFGRLMGELIRDAREHEEAIMVLWASEGGLYQRLGFGLGTRAASVDIETSHASFRHPLERAAPCRLIGLDEAASVLPPLYDAARVTTPGMLARTPSWWAAYRLGDPVHERGGGEPLQCVVFDQEEPGGFGYALYRLHPAYERRLHRDWLEVVEAVHTSAQSAQDLWHYLLGMDLVERVKADFLQEDHPLTLILDEPGRLRLTLSDGLWLRLIDVRQALAARSYAAVGTLTLEVTDTLCEWNRGCWRIEADETGCLVTACEGPADIQLGVEDLAAVYLGAFSFTDLRHADRLVELSDDAATRASAIFQRSRAPWCAEVI